MLQVDDTREIGKYKVRVCDSQYGYYLYNCSVGTNEEIFTQFGIYREDMIKLPGYVNRESGSFPYYSSLVHLENVIEYLLYPNIHTPLNHLIKTILKQC